MILTRFSSTIVNANDQNRQPFFLKQPCGTKRDGKKSVRCFWYFVKNTNKDLRFWLWLVPIFGKSSFRCQWHRGFWNCEDWICIEDCLHTQYHLCFCCWPYRFWHLETFQWKICLCWHHFLDPFYWYGFALKPPSSFRKANCCMTEYFEAKILVFEQGVHDIHPRFRLLVEWNDRRTTNTSWQILLLGQNC